MKKVLSYLSVSLSVLLLSGCAYNDGYYYGSYSYGNPGYFYRPPPPPPPHMGYRPLPPPSNPNVRPPAPPPNAPQGRPPLITTTPPPPPSQQVKPPARPGFNGSVGQGINRPPSQPNNGYIPPSYRR